MAVGRISGPLLKANLLRDGVNLAFETDLLFLDVVNGRIGIKTASPTHDLTVNGTTRSTNLEVTGTAEISDFSITGNTISNTQGTINLTPLGNNPVIYQGKIVTGDLQLSTNVIETTGTNSDLNINTTGTGQVNVNANMRVNGNLHATGNITADGDIQIGDSNTDSISFVAEIKSNIIPDATNTYDLGSDPTAPTGKEWRKAYVKDIIANNVVVNSITVDGIDLALPQGNILYVATTGNNTNSGVHEHDPFLTIKHALTQASAGDTVYIFPGTYQEIFPMTIPAGVTVKGAGLRSVKIVPTVGTNNKDAFLLNGETTIEDITVADYFFDAVNNTGYAFRFATGLTVTSRSPYIRNVTVITKGSVTNAGDPYGFDSNDAGKGAFIDGSVANVASKEASMLFHSATFITPNQETIVATNGVRIEWLNSFTYFADKGIWAYSSSGGFANQGKTRLRIDTRTGTWAVGNTLTYYDTDGTTVLASGTISSIDGNYVSLTGRQLGFETITDRVGKVVYAQGDAKLSQSIKKFGTASLALDGTGDYATVASNPDFNFGTDDWTVELWAYRSVTGVVQTLFDYRPATGTYFQINLGSTGITRFAVNGATVISGPNLVTNTWTHIAVSKVSNVTRMFVNGTVVATTYADTNNYGQATIYIGATNAGASAFGGNIDDLRITKGLGRYTTTFVAPTAPFVGDLNTVLLLHFNGNNNSTTFVDDGITFQDLRTSAGGTATLINFADYSDFGAEIRSIGSANIYGNYGTYGDGQGVIAYLISQNYAYVGSGKKSTNDPNDRIAANEVVELNGAKIYYTSVDNEGNFNVGDFFYVNQKTGDISFNGVVTNITSSSGVTFTDGVNTTTITSTNIDTGNIRISGNTVESLTGNLNLTSANGIINLQNNTFVTGNLDVSGDVTIGGNIQIGDQSTDSINFVAGINSDLIPATNNTYDLGTSSLRWKNVYLNRAEIDGVIIDNNTIQTSGNDDLTIDANGTGKVLVPSSDVEITQDLTVTNNLTVTTGTTNLKDTFITGTLTQVGDTTQTGDYTLTGNFEVTGDITSSGYLQLPQVKIENNTVSTTVTDTDLNLVANGTGAVVTEGIKFQDNNIQSIGANADITLVPQSTGSVVINSNRSLKIPVGTTAERPVSPANGMIRYNTDLSRYEGYNATYNQWLTLSGVQDVDGNTYIKAESSVGANDNVLYFYANGNLVSTIDSTKLFAEKIQTGNLDLTDNTISSITTNSDINLTTSGTGGVRIGNLRFLNNTITNTVSGSVTEFLQSSTGYVKVAGTNGVVIPFGNNTDRPSNAVIGMMRYNTELQIVEIYNGVLWGSIAGASAGISADQAAEISIGYVLTLG